MKKVLIRSLACFLLSVGIFGFYLLKDQKSLEENLTRLHVVANSDSPQDQAVKLKVRDAVLASISGDLQKIADPQEAKDYLNENLPKIQAAANEALEALGIQQQAAVSFCREVFDTRYYDSFSLPAGFYDALRVVIGEGEGHTWWCVAYPSLCLGAASREVEAMAESSGVTEGAAGAITGRYQLRFFLLDLLGKLETLG